MASTNEFAPAIPHPKPFDVQKRIEELQSYLDPKNPYYQPEPQHINIRALIKLYEDGKIDGKERIYIKNGNLIPASERFTGGRFISEGMGYSLALRHAYGHGSFDSNFHEIRMLVRLISAIGGNGTVHRIIVMNDTGSSMMTLDTTDLQQLGNIQGYGGWDLPTAMLDASGVITQYPTIHVQVQLVRDNNTPWGNWLDKVAIVKDHGLNVPRLSGQGIRQAFFIGTAPGNHLLAVSATKGGLGALL